MPKKQDELKRLKKQSQASHKPMGLKLSKVVSEYSQRALKKRKVSKSVYVTEELWDAAKKEFEDALSDIIEAALEDALELRRLQKEEKEPPTS